MLKRTWFVAVLAVASTCGGAPDKTTAPRDVDDLRATPPPAVVKTNAAAPKPIESPTPIAPPGKLVLPEQSASVFGDGFHSYQVRDEERIFAGPRTSDKEHVGYLSARARVVVKSLGTKTSDCQWMELEPRGWICARGEPSTLPPGDETAPALWMPRYDRRVFKDEDDVRANGGYVPAQAPEIVRSFKQKFALEIDRKKYLRTTTGELVPATAVPKYWGDEVAGVAVEGNLELPVAWTWNHDDYKKPTRIRAEPSRRGKVVREIALRSRVDVLEERAGWARIGNDEWISRRDLRIARVATPPAEVTGTDEPWVDVTLNEQTIVLYRGTTPIRATLVSTGRKKYPTPPGLYRVTKKTMVTEFKSPRPDLIEYHIKDVAWAMHFTDLHAMHGAWWNRGFGANVSLGCVNIPSADIRVIYEHMEPKMVPGWWQTVATADNPGSLIRIRR
ncbi:MAG: L,D-transpeptidase family protein [Deltaproteobacteria bacterium]|nr:L,D-transpeptidase family protein [Deltaproteobacteria bacterium]